MALLVALAKLGPLPVARASKTLHLLSTCPVHDDMRGVDSHAQEAGDLLCRVPVRLEIRDLLMLIHALDRRQRRLDTERHPAEDSTELVHCLSYPATIRRYPKMQVGGLAFNQADFKSGQFHLTYDA